MLPLFFLLPFFVIIVKNEAIESHALLRQSTKVSCGTQAFLTDPGCVFGSFLRNGINQRSIRCRPSLEERFLPQSRLCAVPKKKTTHRSTMLRRAHWYARKPKKHYKPSLTDHDRPILPGWLEIPGTSKLFNGRNENKEAVMRNGEETSMKEERGDEEVMETTIDNE